MNETIKYDSIVFYKATKQNYYFAKINGKPKRLHVYIWEKKYGKVPKGYHIHHIDENPYNNDISNLQLLTQFDHLSLHGKSRDIDEQREKMKIAQAAATEWHKSEQGRVWHTKQYEVSLRKRMTEKITLTCQVCGKEYQTVLAMVHKSKYCCNNCKATALRRRRKENA